MPEDRKVPACPHSGWGGGSGGDELCPSPPACSLTQASSSVQEGTSSPGLAGWGGPSILETVDRPWHSGRKWPWAPSDPVNLLLLTGWGFVSVSL